MNERQRRFADEYIISGNAHQSAVKAGYSEKYARTNAHKLLENTSIKARIDERLKLLEKKTIAKHDEVLQYLTSVMRGEMREQVLISRGEVGQGITDIDVCAKDRLKAADILNRVHMAGNVNESKVSVTIVNDIPKEST